MTNTELRFSGGPYPRAWNAAGKPAFTVAVQSSAMTKREEYEAKAEECRATALKANRPDQKESWLSLARSWIQLVPKQSPSALSRLLKAQE